MKGGDTTSKSLIAPNFANPDESGIQIDVPPKGLSNLKIDIAGKGGRSTKAEPTVAGTAAARLGRSRSEPE